MLRPEDVEEQRFQVRFKGYDTDEVDRFLSVVTDTIRALSEQAERAEHECAALQQHLASAQSSRGEQAELLERTLLTAQRTADQVVAEAQEEAEQVRSRARREAHELLEEARQRAAQLNRAIEELATFRDRYREHLQTVIAEHLEQLRGADVPEVPEDVRDLMERAERSAVAGPPEGTAPSRQGRGAAEDG